ncbi:MAG: ATP-grasp domain-containing protein [Ndongobacter sp.]|nr:ATP-grasp domain-containing protein [Ndongobacter sp.]
MNYIFISPNFPRSYENFVVRLREKGICVLGIGDAGYYHLSDALRRNLTEYYKVDDLSNYEQVYRAVAYFIFHYGRIDRLESHNEFWMEQDARLRADFSIPGLRPEQMDGIRRKSEMKKTYEQAGIPTTRGGRVLDFAQAKQLCGQIGYPVCVKPDVGVGAADVCRIDSEKELSRYFLNTDPQPFVIEEFVDAPIVTYDGLTDAQGNIVYCSSMRFDQPILSMVKPGRDFTYYVERTIPQELEQLGRRCVQAFGVRERFFHFEFFRRAEGSLCALEVNLRPPGGYTMDMWDYAGDFDVYAAYAEVLLTGRMKEEPTRPYYCLYYGRFEDQAYRYPPEAFFDRFGVNMCMYRRMEGVFTQMGDYFFIARTPYRETLDEMRDFLAAREE